LETIAEPLYRLLAGIPGLKAARNEPLSRHTRFGIGGPAAIFAETDSEETFAQALGTARQSGVPVAIAGGGSNLVVADSGVDGMVLRYRASRIDAAGTRVRAGSGADLQGLVDFTVDSGLEGMETMTGIPGWVGGAIYGNAGAYGHSISESVLSVRIFDGTGMRSIEKAECEFAYRDSVFKRRKDWIVLSAEFEFRDGDAAGLRRTADEIRRIRDAKYPPSLRCAGSIFKNCLLAEIPAGAAAQVPANVVREGKIPSAWFLEQVGAKGIRRGDIQVATYHANLIYNDGEGKASDLRALIADLKARVEARFGLELEEEVQFLGGF
jgi:UDP-N-acetylmuramate dehydrogenase